MECARCHALIPPRLGDGPVGYGLTPKNEPVCYDCCAVEDKNRMLKGEPITLYLSTNEKGEPVLTNWPGTLRIPVMAVKKGKHNIAGSQYNVRFTFHGKRWYGRQYGEMTQLCRCKPYASTLLKKA